MNKIKFVKNPRLSQIIIKSTKGQMLDDRAVYAIGNNQLKGLIKVSVEEKGSSFKLVYTTTGFVVLKDHLKNTMNKDLFAKLLQNILGVLQSIQDANFSQNAIVFDINYVVVNPSTQNIYFIYVPVKNPEGFGMLRDFLLAIVQNGSFAPGEDPSYIREYVSILNKKANFSLFDLKDYINTISPNKAGIMTRKGGNVRCPRCNSPISDNIKFCASCGAKVAGLTSDFRAAQPLSPQQGDDLPRSNPRRGDSQPIDLLGIPTKPPQLIKPEPPRSGAPQSGRQPFPSQGGGQANRPQYPRQNGITPDGTPLSRRSGQTNRPQYPRQEGIIPDGSPVVRQNRPQYPRQEGIIPAGSPMAANRNRPQYPPQNGFNQGGGQQNVLQFGQNGFPQGGMPGGAGGNVRPGMPQYPQQNPAPPQNNYQQNNVPQGNFPHNGMPPQNAPRNPVQDNVSPAGLDYGFGEAPQSPKPQSPNPNDINLGLNLNLNTPPEVYADDDPYFGGTTVLNEAPAKPAAAYLLRISTGEKTPIDKPQFTVGRMLGHVDYCVTNNSAIGRQHLKITNNNGRYFVCDLNSTNGTFVDERQIPKNVDTEVFSGAKVTLANEDFKFIIE